MTIKNILLASAACAAMALTVSQVSAQSPSGAPAATEQKGAPAGGAAERNPTAQKPMDSDREKGNAQRPAAAQSGDGKNAPKAAQGQGRDRDAIDQKNGGAGNRNAQGDGNRDSTSGQGAGGAARGARVTLNAQQKTRVHDIVLKENVKKVTKVSFNVSVGTRVVRSPDIELRPLSTQIIEVVPEYRGYLFFVYNNEVVIVEPDTLEIVTIINT